MSCLYRITDLLTLTLLMRIPMVICRLYIYSSTTYYCSMQKRSTNHRFVGLTLGAQLSIPASPVPHPSGTGDGAISFTDASIGGVGSHGHRPDLGGGGALHLRLEEGERRLHRRGYLAHVGHRALRGVVQASG